MTKPEVCFDCPHYDDINYAAPVCRLIGHIRADGRIYPCSRELHARHRDMFSACPSSDPQRRAAFAAALPIENGRRRAPDKKAIPEWIPRGLTISQ